MNISKLTVTQFCYFGLPSNLVFDFHHIYDLAIQLSLVTSDPDFQTLHQMVIYNYQIITISQHPNSLFIFSFVFFTDSIK